MARASRRRTTRNRDRYGRYVTKSTRENPRKKKKSVKKSAPKMRRAASKRKASPKRKTTTRRTAPRRVAREVQENPRPRRKARRVAREEVVYEMATENPRKKSAKRKLSKKQIKALAAGRRAAARRKTRAFTPAVVKRGGAAPRLGALKIEVVQTTRRPAAPKRKAAKKAPARKAKKAAKAKQAKRAAASRAKTVQAKKPRKRTRGGISHSAYAKNKKAVTRAAQLGTMTIGRENPLGFGIGEYALENPLSGGELALAFVAGSVGYLLSDVLDRYLATSSEAAQQAKISNADAVNTPPGIMRVLAQAGVAALPLIGAYFVRSPMARASLQGAGLGSLFHLGGQLFKSYMIPKLLPNNATAQRLYGEAIAGAAKKDAVVQAGGTVRGLPPHYALLTAGRPAWDVGPRAAVGVGEWENRTLAIPSPASPSPIASDDCVPCGKVAPAPGPSPYHEAAKETVNAIVDQAAIFQKNAGLLDLRSGPACAAEGSLAGPRMPIKDLFADKD